MMIIHCSPLVSVVSSTNYRALYIHLLFSSKLLSMNSRWALILNHSEISIKSAFYACSRWPFLFPSRDYAGVRLCHGVVCYMYGYRLCKLSIDIRYFLLLIGFDDDVFLLAYIASASFIYAHGSTMMISLSTTAGNMITRIVVMISLSNSSTHTRERS